MDEPLASALDTSRVRRPARLRLRNLKRGLLLILGALLIEAMVWSPSAAMHGAAASADALPLKLPFLKASPTPSPTPSSSSTATSSSSPTPAPSSAPPAGALQLQIDDGNVGPSYLAALNGVEGPGGQVFDQSLQQWSTGAASLLSPLHLHFERCCQPVNPQYCPSASTDCTYHWASWQSSQADVSPQAAIAAFRQVSSTGDTPMFIVNVDRGTPAEAAGFVHEVNVTLGAHVAWWEIGNEEAFSPDLQGNLPAACDGTAAYGFGQMYGCVVHQYAQAMRAVDPSIHIAADYDGTSLTDLLSTAGPDIDALDVHQYTPPADPGTTTFTGDGQTQGYVADMTSLNGLTEVTIAAWMVEDHWDGVAPPAVRLLVDGKGITTSAGGNPQSWTTITRGSYAPWAQPVVGYALLAPGVHTITVSACTSSAVVQVPAACSDGTYGKWSAALRGLTWSPPIGGALMPSPAAVEQRNEANRCFGAPGPDVRVDTTWPYATQPGSTTQPWRLSASDFDIAFTAGWADSTRTELEGPTSNGRSLRERLDAYNAAVPPGAAPWHGSVLIGEYAAFGGCAALPRTVTDSMVGAMGDAVDLMHLIEDSGRSTYPVIAASHFALDSVDSKQCIGWTVAEETTCAPGGTPFLGAEGAVLSLIWGLSGARVPASLLYGPQVTTAQLSALSSLPGTPLLRALACQPGAAGTVEVAVANISPTQSFSLPIWDSGHRVSFVSSLDVSAPPDAVNDPGNTRRVAVVGNALSHVDNTSYTTVTLPPFSVSLITVSVA